MTKNIFILLFFLSYLFSIDISLDPHALNGSDTETYTSTIDYNAYSLLHDYIDIKNYTTGPGDIFLFNMVTSSRIVNLELIVSPSGTILIPIVGILDVKGKTIDYVYDAIIKKCKARYEDAYVYVELIKTRNFKVLITGDFIHSGMFPVSSVDRVSDLIESISTVDSTLFKHFPDLSKNILLNKDIHLIRKDSLIDIDLFKYYIDADFSLNPMLQEGDIINIKNSNKITVLGAIQNPIRINIKNNMTYNDLINLAGKKYEGRNLIKVINYKMLAQYSDTEINRISVIDPKYRSDIDESFLNSRLKIDQGIFSVFINKETDYNVSPGDVVIVKDIMDYVEIIGGVKTPGTYKYRKGLSITNYINQAGSFSKDARNKNIYIIDQVNGTRNKVTTSYSPNPGDIIFIEEKASFKRWERFNESISIIGTLATLYLVISSI